MIMRTRLWLCITVMISSAQELRWLHCFLLNAYVTSSLLSFSLSTLELELSLSLSSEFQIDLTPFLCCSLESFRGRYEVGMSRRAEGLA